MKSPCLIVFICESSFNIIILLANLFTKLFTSSIIFYMSTFDYKCESCKLKTGCLYFNKLDKKWYCKLHSPYLIDERSNNNKKRHHGAYKRK